MRFGNVYSKQYVMLFAIAVDVAAGVVCRFCLWLPFRSARGLFPVVCVMVGFFSRLTILTQQKREYPTFSCCLSTTRGDQTAALTQKQKQKSPTVEKRDRTAHGSGPQQQER